MKKNKLVITLIIATSLLIVLPAIATAGLVQGQSLPNGTLFITSYQTPLGTQYPQPFDSFHANNLSLTVYSPFNTTQTANIHVKSQTLIGTTKNDTQKFLTVYENQTFTIEPRRLQQIDLLIPKNTQKQTVTMTWDNVSVTYYIQTYQPAVFPFGNNPLGLLALVGILMLAFTGINIGITKVILQRAKYFPKLSQRAWLGLIVLSGIIIYGIIDSYYYDLTGQDWAVWLIPLWFFNLLMVLNAWSDGTEETLLLHIHETRGHDLETGLYSIRTAKLTEKETGKQPKENQEKIEEEYIDNRSYVDFVKRLFNRHIPILMEASEHPDEMENVEARKPLPERRKKPWKMVDRKGKEHPFSKAYLIDPLSMPPIITEIETPTQKLRKDGTPKTKKSPVLLSHLNGKHMKEAEYFLSNYVTASESGKEIHRLSLDLATNQAELNTKAYAFQKELIDKIYEIRGFKTNKTDGKVQERQQPEKETPKEEKEDKEE